MCHTVTKPECHPVVKQVPEQKCHTEYEKVCHAELQTTYVHDYVDECKPVHKKVKFKDQISFISSHNFA